MPRTSLKTHVDTRREYRSELTTRPRATTTEKLTRTLQSANRADSDDWMGVSRPDGPRTAGRFTHRPLSIRLRRVTRAFLQAAVGDADDVARFRKQLAAFGRALRNEVSPKALPYWHGYVTLFEAAYELQHGLPRMTVRRLIALEREQQTGVGEVMAHRGQLARVVADVRKARDVNDELLDRCDALVAQANYIKAVDPTHQRSCGATATELETDFTLHIVELLDVDLRALLALKSSAYRLSRLEPKRAALETATYEAAKEITDEFGGGHWAQLTEDQREAFQKVWRYEISERFDRAMTALEELAMWASCQVEDVPWADIGAMLGPEVQRDLIAGKTLELGDFLNSREVPHVSITQSPRVLELTREVTIDGKTYGPGPVELPALLHPRVEYRDVADSSYLHGLELHRITGGRAGKASTESFEIMAALGSDMRHQHQHHINRVRRAVAEKKPGAVFGQTDHWRRACLYSELQFAERCGELRDLRQGGLHFSGFSHAGEPAALYDRLTGGYGSGFKVSTIGARFNMYRDPETGRDLDHLYGYEARTITTPPMQLRNAAAKNSREAWLDAIQRGQVTGHWGIGPRALEAYLREHAGDERGAHEEMRLLARLHYVSDDSATLRFRSAPAAIADLAEAHPELLALPFDDNHALQMLTHDWSRDTMWLCLPAPRRRAAIAKVERAQVRALKQIAGGKSVTDVIKRFAKNSDLRAQVGRSLAMPALTAQFNS